MATSTKAKYKLSNSNSIGSIAKQKQISSIKKQISSLTKKAEVKAQEKVSSLTKEVESAKAAKAAANTANNTNTGAGAATGSSIEDVAKGIVVPDYKQDETAAAIQNRYKTDATTEIDEATIRKQARDNIQAEIDAIEAAAAGKLRNARQTNKAAQGNVNALNARSGLLGSDFGMAATGRQDAAFNEVADEIQNEKQLAIQKAYQEAEAAALGIITDKRAAQKLGSEKYLEFIESEGEKKKAAAKTFAKSLLDKGIDVTELTPDQISKLVTSYGLSDAEFNQLYKATKDEDAKTAAEAAKLAAETKKAEAAANSFELSEGQAKYVIDEETGEVKQVAKNAKTFAPKATSGGDGPGSSGTYGNDLDALAGQVKAGLNGKYKQEQFSAQFARARTVDDKIALIASVADMPADIKKDLIQTANAKYQLRQAINLVKSGVQTGVLQKAAQYGLGIGGGQLSPELTQISQLITAATQPYRNSVTGAAWGDQETAEYNTLFGSIKDTPETLLTKLENLEKIMSDGRVNLIAAAVDPFGSNSSFDSYRSDYETTYNQYGEDGGGNAPGTVDILNRGTGKVITIPVESLQDALDSGEYEEI